jgi:NTP pyrophosphatase (non-canonical NTP hydrolase)
MKTEGSLRAGPNAGGNKLKQAILSLLRYLFEETGENQEL